MRRFRRVCTTADSSSDNRTYSAAVTRRRLLCDETGLIDVFRLCTFNDESPTTRNTKKIRFILKLKPTRGLGNRYKNLTSKRYNVRHYYYLYYRILKYHIFVPFLLPASWVILGPTRARHPLLSVRPIRIVVR